jgi:hypothetical protein
MKVIRFIEPVEVNTIVQLTLNIEMIKEGNKNGQIKKILICPVW